MFDKANREEHLESLRTEHESLLRQIKDLEGKLPDVDKGEGLPLQSEIEHLRRRSESIEATVRKAEEQEDGERNRKA